MIIIIVYHFVLCRPELLFHPASFITFNKGATHLLQTYYALISIHGAACSGFRYNYHFHFFKYYIITCYNYFSNLFYYYNLLIIIEMRQ